MAHTTRHRCTDQIGEVTAKGTSISTAVYSSGGLYRGTFKGFDGFAMAAEHDRRVGRFRERSNPMETERDKETTAESDAYSMQVAATNALWRATHEALRAG